MVVDFEFACMFYYVLLTRCVDEGRVQISCQQRVREISEKLFQQRSYIMDAVLLIHLYLPPLVKLFAKLDEIL